MCVWHLKLCEEVFHLARARRTFLRSWPWLWANRPELREREENCTPLVCQLNDEPLTKEVFGRPGFRLLWVSLPDLKRGILNNHNNVGRFWGLNVKPNLATGPGHSIRKHCLWDESSRGDSPLLYGVGSPFSHIPHSEAFLRMHM